MFARASTYSSRGVMSSLFRKSGGLSLSNTVRRVISTTSVQQDGAADRDTVKEIVNDDGLQNLLLHKVHVENGAEFTSFRGFKMPWIYAGKSLRNEVFFTRKEASVFDASYRPQIYLSGKNISKIMEAMVTSDLQEMKPDEAVLTLMTNPQGGIIDDLVVTKLNENELHIVANTPKVIKEIKKNTQMFENEVQMRIPNDMTLLTFQGPECSKLLQLLIFENVCCLPFMHSLQGDTVFWNEISRLTRCSDTGEDGFMLSLPACQAEEFLSYAVTNNPGYLILIGLRAREALRIEAGHCLSGVDYNEKTTPVQAKLDSLIGNRRRIEGKFPGADIILKELNNKSNPISRVGFVASDSCNVGGSIMDPKGNVIGKVTSACFSPCLQQHIGMAYVATEFAQNGKELFFDKNIKGIAAEIPLVKNRSYTNVNLF
ncbi:Aminomethyltransferase, mitochondrial [Araneus ventricosus]|uniref:Aminomethyltransferase, mitochondrial n=1 Tax=Araneus ventricosus TaxID=182803 RepID=A0A4Y2E0T1_ARAVE|nr:Aminomethyltransferase, mitochondrial [Araneus ventricosus]